MAFLRPITANCISKICKSCFLLHYQKYNVFYALPFSKTSKIKIYKLKFFKLQQFQYFAMIFNYEWWCFCFGCDGRRVLHGSSLLQDNCLDLIRRAFLHKLSAFCQHLLGLIKSAILAATDISKPKYRADISIYL